MLVAQHWNLTPTQWDNLTLKDKEEMTALYKTEKLMNQWENFIQQREMDKNSRKNKGKKGFKQ